MACIAPFAAILTANIALAFFGCNWGRILLLGHAHALYTVVWKIFFRIYFVVKYFQVNNFRGLSIPTKIF